MSCSNCSNEKVFSRGLCSGCYSRLRRRGTIERKNVVNRGECSVEGCCVQAVSKGFCMRHYLSAQHPLKNVWKLLRSRAPGQFPKRWERFDDFVADVGMPPSDRHQLRRPDPSKPWSTSNMHWLQIVPERHDLLTPEGRKAYEREWRFRKRYGISVADYDAMVVAQDGKCAICGRGEKHHHDGKIRDLSVDHNHRTGKARALLCSMCNKIIGLADDSIPLLRSTIAYLERHSELNTDEEGVKVAS